MTISSEGPSVNFKRPRNLTSRGATERGRRYICDRKDEIVDGLSQSVKCVAPFLGEMLAKV